MGSIALANNPQRVAGKTATGFSRAEDRQVSQNEFARQDIGAWKLHSYSENPVDGAPPFHPMGSSPKGIIMYTPDGYMSAQFMLPDRPNSAINDFYQGTLEEYKQLPRPTSHTPGLLWLTRKKAQSRTACSFRCYQIGSETTNLGWQAWKAGF